MNDPNVHVANHPSGHPNKTAVNPENPIFGRPADPVVTEASIEQAAIVQSDKNARETVVSPLINEEQLSPAVDDDPTGDRAYGSGPDEPVGDDASDAETTAEAPQDSEPSVEEPAAEVVEETPADPVVTEAEPASAEA